MKNENSVTICGRAFVNKSVVRGSWGSIENWLETKTEPPSGNLALPKSVKRSVSLREDL